MKVSVVVPNYNHSQYLRERIDSILHQTYDDYEIIIMDDCSIDNSLDVIGEYENDPRVASVVMNDKNSGSPFLQWKKGIELAKGDLVWIAESDDFCSQDFLEKLVRVFEEDRNCVLSWCASVIVDEHGGRKGIHPNLRGLGTLHCQGKLFNSKYMSKCNAVVNASSAVFKRSAALAVENGYEKFRSYGDYLFWVGLSSKGNVSYLPEEMNYFRFHSFNTTMKSVISERGVLESLQVNDFLLENCLRSSFKHFMKKVDLLYRLKYILKVPDDVLRAVPGGVDPLMKSCLSIKRLKRLAANR